MTLRIRTALAVLAACTVAVVVLYFTLQGILAARFTTLERQKANQDLGRAFNVLNQEVNSVEIDRRGLGVLGRDLPFCTRPEC